MTDELKPDEHISEFISAGPKNYAYRIVTRDGTKTVCKIRGITLNYSTIQTIDFDVMRDMILNDQPTTVTVHTEHKIKRKRQGDACIKIITEPEDKIYRISFFKRRRLPDINSLPLGYK
jgi:hypothetical protein